jgi:predicted RNA binding protein YcfA (HicA-like mRNA interferase family)
LNPPLPVVSGAEVVKALITAGFFEVSQRGSHRKLRHSDATVIVPMHKELASGTLRSIIRQSGMSVEEFLALL